MVCTLNIAGRTEEVNDGRLLRLAPGKNHLVGELVDVLGYFQVHNALLKTDRPQPCRKRENL